MIRVNASSLSLQEDTELRLFVVCFLLPLLLEVQNPLITEENMMKKVEKKSRKMAISRKRFLSFQHSRKGKIVWFMPTN